MKKLLSILLMGACGLAFAQHAPLDRKDRQFVQKAAGGGMEEVAAGKMALRKAESPQVKSFADMLIADHSANNKELQALARRKGVTLPAALPGKEEEKIETMRHAKRFDPTFIRVQGLEDHKQDIRDFEQASRDARDPDVRAYAARTLPVLRKHLERAQALARPVGAGKG